jgi:hypothetical protein
MKGELSTRRELQTTLNRLVAEQQELLEARHRSVISLSRNLKSQERVRRQLQALDRQQQQEEGAA